MTQSADGGAAAPLCGSEALASPGAGRSLLLVDDDAPLRRSMARALERRGFHVLAAEGLAEARDHAHAHKPEFAVLDMRLTEGSGLDLVRTLRELRPEVRIVIVTGYGNIATAVAAIKAGAVDYLAKPVDADDVVEPSCAAARACRRRAKIRCRPTGCAGSTSSGSSSSATATCRRPRAASTCTAAPCSGS